MVARGNVAHRLLAGGLAGAVVARAGRVGADGRHMQQVRHPGSGGEAGDTAGALGVDAVKFSCARFRQDAHQVDHDAGTFGGAADGGLALHRGEQGHDLPYGAGGLEEQGGFGIAHRNADHEALVRQPLDDVAADEAGAAEHCRHTARCHRCVLLWGAAYTVLAPRRAGGHGQPGKASVAVTGPAAPTGLEQFPTPVVHWMQRAEIACKFSVRRQY